MLGVLLFFSIGDGRGYPFLISICITSRSPLTTEFLLLSLVYEAKLRGKSAKNDKFLLSGICGICGISCSLNIKTTIKHKIVTKFKKTKFRD